MVPRRSKRRHRILRVVPAAQTRNTVQTHDADAALEPRIEADEFLVHAILMDAGQAGAHAAHDFACRF